MRREVEELLRRWRGFAVRSAALPGDEPRARLVRAHINELVTLRDELATGSHDPALEAHGREVVDRSEALLRLLIDTTRLDDDPPGRRRD